MKKKNLFSFLFLICINAVYSQSIYRDNDLRYIGIEEMKSYHLYNKKDNPSCNLKINFFYPLVSADIQLQNKLQSYFIKSFFGPGYEKLSPEKAVKEFSKAYVEDYKDQFERTNLYKNDIEDTKTKGEDMKEYDFLYLYEKTIRNTILFNRGNIISQVINTYEYTGGAHGASFTQGFVYDISSGKDITFDDLFYDNSENFISELLLSCLMEERRFQDEDAMIDAGFNSSFIPPSRNFVADDKGITFIYNRYELGAYVLGMVEIFVPYNELFIYMKPESVLFRWAERTFSGNRVKYETSYLNKEFFAYDPEHFPGFISQIQFTYPKAYYDEEILNMLQKQFVINAFGEKYSDRKASEIVEIYYNELFSEYESYITSDEVKDFIKKELMNENPEVEKSGIYLMSLGKEFTFTNVFHLNQDDLISYETIIYTYDGGAHGLEVTQGFTILLSQAKNLIYEDVFEVNSKEKVKALIIGNLLLSKDYHNLTQLKAEGYEVDLIIPGNNFYLDNEGVTFIFTPYEIGPYSLGTTKVKVSYVQLAEYLHRDFKK